MPARSYLLQTPHQPLSGEMLADGCPLGNVDGTATANFVGTIPWLLSGIPPGASLCGTWVLAHIAFSFKVKLTSVEVSIDWFSHSKIEMEQRCQVFSLVGHSLGLSTGTAWERQTGPCAPQIFITLLLSHMVRMEEYRCYAGTTPHRCCTQCAHKCKRQY
jgi:hypothetical protein